MSNPMHEEQLRKGRCGYIPANRRDACANCKHLTIRQVGAFKYKNRCARNDIAVADRAICDDYAPEGRRDGDAAGS